MYRHSLDTTGKCSEDGSYAEQLFVKKFYERFKTEPIKTKKEDDKYKHIDYTFSIKDKNGVLHEASCDVKYPKKIRREDKEVSKDFTWVEFVSKGHPGWMYGEQKYIAFLLPDYQTFLMVSRERLLTVCNALVSQEFVLRPDEAFHKLYCRPQLTLGLADVMSLISYDELKTCSGNWEL